MVTILLKGMFKNYSTGGDYLYFQRCSGQKNISLVCVTSPLGFLFLFWSPQLYFLTIIQASLDQVEQSSALFRLVMNFHISYFITLIMYHFDHFDQSSIQDVAQCACVFFMIFKKNLYIILKKNTLRLQFFRQCYAN